MVLFDNWKHFPPGNPSVCLKADLKEQSRSLLLCIYFEAVYKAVEKHSEVLKASLLVMQFLSVLGLFIKQIS